MFLNKISTEQGTVTLVLLILLALSFMAFWPLALIWALNTLFPMLAITYSFWNWLAVCVLNITYFTSKPTKA